MRMCWRLDHWSSSRWPRRRVLGFAFCCQDHSGSWAGWASGIWLWGPPGLCDSGGGVCRHGGADALFGAGRGEGREAAAVRLAATRAGLPAWAREQRAGAAWAARPVTTARASARGADPGARRRSLLRAAPPPTSASSLGPHPARPGTLPAHTRLQQSGPPASGQPPGLGCRRAGAAQEFCPPGELRPPRGARCGDGGGQEGADHLHRRGGRVHGGEELRELQQRGGGGGIAGSGAGPPGPAARPLWRPPTAPGKGCSRGGGGGAPHHTPRSG